jgi:hypothetical protein
MQSWMHPASKEKETLAFVFSGDIRGRILGEIHPKVLKSFPPCYSMLPLQLFLKIYISQPRQTHETSYSFYSSLLYTVKEKGGTKLPHKELQIFFSFHIFGKRVCWPRL